MAKPAFKTVAFDGVVKTFDGKPLESYEREKDGKVITELTYETESVEYADSDAGLEAIKAAGLMPNRTAIVQQVNQRLKAKARAKAIADVYKENAFEKPDSDSFVAKWDNLYKAMIGAGRTKDDAVKLANMGANMTRDEAAAKDAEQTESESETVDA